MNRNSYGNGGIQGVYNQTEGGSGGEAIAQSANPDVAQQDAPTVDQPASGADNPAADDQPGE